MREVDRPCPPLELVRSMARPRRRAAPARPADDALGMIRRPSPATSVAPSPRSASVSRKPSRGEPAASAVGGTARTPGRPRGRRRGTPARCRRPWRRAGSWCGPRARTAAGREDRRAGAELEQLVAVQRERPAARLAVRDQAEHGRAFEDGDARVGEHARDQRLGHAPARLRAADAQHPPPAVGALQAERRLTFLVGVEDDAVRLEVVDAPDAVLAQHPHGRLVAQAVAGGEGVRDVEVGVVVDGHGGRDAALGPERVGGAQRALRGASVTRQP